MYFCLPLPLLRALFPLIFFFILVGFSVPASSAARCPVPTILANGEFFKRDVVFTGTVLSIRKIPDTDRELGGWFYRLSVGEVFRGPIRKELTVYTEDSDIRFPLEKNSKYLLFASTRRGRLEIDSCGNSASFSKATDSLRRLKDMNGGKQPSEIEGWVAAETGGIDVSGVVVTIKSPSKVYTATTDKDGWFHFFLPSGRYKVDFTSREYYLNADDDFWYAPGHFTLHAGECASLQVVSVRRLSK